MLQMSHIPKLMINFEKIAFNIFYRSLCDYMTANIRNAVLVCKVNHIFAV